MIHQGGSQNRRKTVHIVYGLPHFEKFPTHITPSSFHNLEKLNPFLRNNLQTYKKSVAVFMWLLESNQYNLAQKIRQGIGIHVFRFILTYNLRGLKIIEITRTSFGFSLLVSLKMTKMYKPAH